MLGISGRRGIHLPAAQARIGVSGRISVCAALFPSATMIFGLRCRFYGGTGTARTSRPRRPGLLSAVAGLDELR